MQTQTFIALAQQPELYQDADAIIRQCVHCGFCNATCPTYQLLGDERDGPRGRIYLIKQALEGGEATRKTQQHLDRCLTCLACETTCPSGVRYGKLLDIGRDTVERQVSRTWWDSLKRWLLVSFLPYQQRVAVLIKLVRVLSPCLPQAWRRKIPVHRQAIKVNGHTPKKYNRNVLLLEGCVQPGLAPEINLATEKVLNKLGVGVIKAATAGCCGALSYHLSYQRQGLDFMRCNIDAWLPYLDDGVEAIVTTSSGCGLMVKDYGEALKHDAAYCGKAARISAVAKDVVEILEQADLSMLTPKVQRKVAFHSPCTLQHGQKLNGRVEDLLKQRGFELAHVLNPHLCCGSAGAYSLMQSKLSGQLLKEKITALENGEPEEIMTANIGCLLHLRSAASVPVRHWVEALAS